MKPPTLGYLLPTRTGVLSLVWDKNGVTAMGPSGQLATLTDNQRKILSQLSVAKEGLLAAELSKSLGLTHAGVLWLLKPLLEKGIIERVALRGGGVLYYMPFRVAEKLSPQIEGARKSVETKAGKPVQEMTLEELYESSKDFEDDVKQVLYSWIFEGGWKRS